MRSSAYKRQMAWRKAKRKANLEKALNPNGKPIYDNLHQYSKTQSIALALIVKLKHEIRETAEKNLVIIILLKTISTLNISVL